MGERARAGRAGRPPSAASGVPRLRADVVSQGGLSLSSLSLHSDVASPRRVKPRRLWEVSVCVAVAARGHGKAGWAVEAVGPWDLEEARPPTHSASAPRRGGRSVTPLGVGATVRGDL